MAISIIPESIGQEGEASPIQPGQPRGLTVRERFDALPEDVKDAILDKHRHWNVEHVDWYASVYDCFKTDVEQIGIEVDKMYFSGFWSQGDGACFEGTVRDWPLFLGSLGYTCPALINHASMHFRLYVEHRGHYYHENCTSFSADIPLPEHADDQDFADGYIDQETDSVQEAVVLALLNQYDTDKLYNEFVDAFKDHMRELYKRLEAEYDHLTSDEAVLDSLEANDQLEEAINDAMENEDA